MTKEQKLPSIVANVPGWAQHESLGPVKLHQVAGSVSSSTSPTPTLLRVDEAATFLQVSSKTVRRLVARGDLNVVRIGRSVRIHFSEIQRLVASGGARGGGVGDGERHD